MEPLGRRPFVLGHRGARQEAPENTIPSFRRALELGADGVELDARLTADGAVIVLHDDDVARTTDGQGRADELTLEEIQRFDAGVRFGPVFAGTRIPTLAEALEALASARLVNVELKGPDVDIGLEQQAVEVVRAAGMLDRVIFSSFSPAQLRRLRQLDGQIAVAYLFSRPWQWWGALPLARVLRLQALHPGRLAVTAGAVHQAHARGLRVVPWTINAASDVRRMLAWGVDGIISDVPAEVRKIGASLGSSDR